MDMQGLDVQIQQIQLETQDAQIVIQYVFGAEAESQEASYKAGQITVS